MTATPSANVKARWFEEHRQDWIAEVVRIFGFINRTHIQRKFGISTAQASIDLQTYQRRNPDAVSYNKTAKRYQTTESLTIIDEDAQ